MDAYEDRPNHQPRVKTSSRRGNGFLRAIGGLLIVGGIFWGTYLYTSTRDVSQLTKTPGPMHVCGVGVIVSILSKFF